MKKHILIEMGQKTSEELVDIWKKNNRAEWTNEAFEVIKEILLERSGELPSKDSPIHQISKETSQPLFTNLFPGPKSKGVRFSSRKFCPYFVKAPQSPPR